MSNLTRINQRLATSLPNSTSLCSSFQPIRLHTLPLLELLFPMCSHLTISRDRQICICIDLSLALSPLFPQDHYFDSGPHSLPLWPHSFNIIPMYIFWEPITSQAFTRHWKYSRDQMRQQPCFDGFCLLLLRKRKQTNMRNEERHGKKKKKASTFSSLSPWFKKTRSLSSSWTLRFLFCSFYLWPVIKLREIQSFA